MKFKASGIEKNSFESKRTRLVDSHIQISNFNVYNCINKDKIVLTQVQTYRETELRV